MRLLAALLPGAQQSQAIPQGPGLSGTLGALDSWLWVPPAHPPEAAGHEQKRVSPDRLERVCRGRCGDAHGRGLASKRGGPEAVSGAYGQGCFE